MAYKQDSVEMKRFIKDEINDRNVGRSMPRVRHSNVDFRKYKVPVE
jgi:hypothetical protein